jgi:hypothetical protein
MVPGGRGTLARYEYSLEGGVEVYRGARWTACRSRGCWTLVIDGRTFFQDSLRTLSDVLLFLDGQGLL